MIDYVIIRRKDLGDIKCTRAMRGPDCFTDHFLIKATFKFAIQRMFSRTRPQQKRRLNVKRLTEPEQQIILEQATTSALENQTEEQETLDEEWERLHHAVYQAAAATQGYVKRKNADWFSDNEQGIRTAIEERNHTLRAKLSNPCPENIAKLKEARAKLQRDLRRMEDDWWLNRALTCKKKPMKTTPRAFSLP